MTGERPSIEERVGKAIARGNMRQREGECDLNVIGALGMVGIKERLADAVYRLKYANESRSYNDAYAGLHSLATTLSKRSNWRLKRKRMRWMVKRVLHYWLNDGCRECTGIRFETVEGSPHLSARICAACHGSGKLIMPWIRRLPREPEGRRATRKRRQQWERVCRMLNDHMARHRLLLVALENSERWIGEKMHEQLRRVA